MRTAPFKRKKAGPPADVPLNITAMADIFVILLVFLLKSFSTGSVSITPSKGLQLPEAQAEQPNIEALVVEVSKDAVLLEGKLVSKLFNYNFPASDIIGNGSSRTLGEALARERHRQTEIAKVNSSVKVDARILVASDQKVPYSTLKTVLASAAVNGYTDFKLAVVKEGS